MDNKQEAMAALRQACRETLEPLDKRVVPGRGSLDARLVLVGEAPGAEEEKLGQPFVGRAGKNLDEFLEALRMDKQDIYITNVVKIRPTRQKTEGGRLSNRPPSREEIALCLPFLTAELDLIDPLVVVTLGNVALAALGGEEKLRIGEVHGRILPREQAPYRIFPMYHPASMIYRPALRGKYYEDMRVLKGIFTALLENLTNNKKM
ncbi:MAG: uracil-DNA glycosylase [Christensenellales bacterium]|jgi:uracil-DNA glycosylase family 4